MEKCYFLQHEKTSPTLWLNFEFEMFWTELELLERLVQGVGSQNQLTEVRLKERDLRWSKPGSDSCQRSIFRYSSPTHPWVQFFYRKSFRNHWKHGQESVVHTYPFFRQGLFPVPIVVRSQNPGSFWCFEIWVSPHGNPQPPFFQAKPRCPRKVSNKKSINYQ